MKKQLLKSALIGAVGLAVFSGNALATVQQCDPNDPVCTNGAKQFEITSYVNDYISVNNSETYTFNLNGEDGITALDTILSAYLYLYLSDDNNSDSSESIKLKYEHEGWGTSRTINWNNNSGDQISANLSAYLTNDHTLTVTVGAGTGDFKLDRYDLSGCYSSPAPVPEPTTMLLFGTGLCSLAAVSRRKTDL